MRKLIVLLASSILLAILGLIAFRPASAVTPDTSSLVASIEKEEIEEIQEIPLAPIGRVTVSNLLNLRQDPNSTSPIITSLAAGIEVEVYDYDGEWVLVSADGIFGWALSDFVNVGTFPLGSDDWGIPLSEADCYNNACWVTNDTWFTPSPQHTIGNAVFYAPLLMEATAEYRGMSLEGFLGGVALANCADIGQVVWLRVGQSPWEGPFLVADCSQRNHVWEHTIIKSQSVEVDFDTALRWGMVSQESNYHWSTLFGRRPNVEVWKGVLPPEIETNPIPYAQFIMDTAEVTYIYTPNRQWSIAYAEFTNYEDYLKEIE